MQYKNLSIIILAAGKGTRMKSPRPKVLHKINNKPMINCVIETAQKISKDNIIIVVGYKADEVKNEISKNFQNLSFALQETLDGSGSAVRYAVPHLKDNIENVLILCGDVPFIKLQSLQNLIQNHKKNNNALTLIAIKTDNPTGYGRIIQDAKGNLIDIIEEKDATLEEKKINIVNSGVYCIKKNFLQSAIHKLKSNNAQKEFYLTDLVKIAYNEKENQSAIILDDFNEFLGVNSIEDLEKASKMTIGLN